MTFGVHFLFAFISDFLQNHCPPKYYIDPKYMILEILNYMGEIACLVLFFSEVGYLFEFFLVF